MTNVPNTTSARTHCAEYSRTAGEAMVGTVRPVELWLLVEYRGRWERDAISVFSDEVKKRLLEFKAEVPSMRLALIKQPQRKSGPLKVFWAFSREQKPRLYEREIGSHDELALLETNPQDESEGRLIAVCTHGTHDLCCAEFGNEIYSELLKSSRNVWQISHVGGCRFAPNVVCLPHGIVYGRVKRQDCLAIAETYRNGHMLLEKLRGRSCYSRPVQAAETFLRSAEHLMAFEDVRLAGAEEGRTGDWEITFLTTRGTKHQISLRIEPSQTSTYKSCSGVSPRPRDKFTQLSVATQ